jgi:hypothetical protein
MSQTLKIVQAAVARGEVLISDHAYDRIAENDIVAQEIADGVRTAMLVEDYPDYHKGPSILVLQRDRNNKPIHVVWGLRKGTSSPAVIITAYRPDPQLWTDDFRRRR